MPLVHGLKPLVAAAVLLLMLAGTAADAQAPDLSRAYRERRALVIGINAYVHWKTLGYARSDAEAVGKKLEALGFKVDYLLDRQATREAIIARLSELRRHVVDRDQVFIYFSGHGQTEEVGVGPAKDTLGYLVPADGRQDDPFQTAISMTQLRDLAKALRAYHVMFALDACFSGALLTAKGTGGTRERTPAYFQEMLARPVRFVLTAGTAEQEAVEVGRAGLFTRHLLAALDGAALRSDGRGVLTGSDIATYVERSVIEQAAQYGRRQTPQWGPMIGQGSGEFLLALRTAPEPASRRPSEPAPPSPPAHPASPPSLSASPSRPPAPPGAPQPGATPPAPVPLPPVASIPPGSVRIESTPPGADVYWNGRPVGKTPLTIEAAEGGRSQLVIAFEGHATLIEDVNVTAGQAQRIARTLAAQAGALDVQTTPAGASIELDGVPVGTTPQKLARLRIGKHHVKLAHRDYLAVEREVTIDHEQTARLDVQLPPKPARLVITSTPAQADVMVGGRKLGTTVWAGELPAGKHQLRVAKEGYEERVIDVDLGPNESRALDLQLRKWDLGDMVPVPAGEFWMGSDAEGDADEKPRHRVHLDAFAIDTYEVTNAQFKAFVDARGYERQELWSADGWRWRTSKSVTRPSYWTDSKWNEPKQPVVGVSWYEADAFCRFAGKRLPTEAEWEKAARGTDRRTYPWGEQWDAKRANASAGKTVPVGSYPGGVSPYGAHDMAGNVWEWVADWYGGDYYQRSPQRNPRGPDSGSSRVLRGGSWSNYPIYLRAALRYFYSPVNRDNYLGFRCARGLP